MLQQTKREAEQSAFATLPGLKSAKKERPDNIKMSPNQARQHSGTLLSCFVFVSSLREEMRRCEGFGTAVWTLSSRSAGTPGELLQIHLNTHSHAHGAGSSVATSGPALARSITCCLRWMVADSQAAAVKEKWRGEGRRAVGQGVERDRKRWRDKQKSGWE